MINSATIHGSVPSCDTSKEFLNIIDQKFKEYMAKVVNLKSNFANARYDNVGDITDYIPRIVHIASRLKELKVPDCL